MIEAQQASRHRRPTVFLAYGTTGSAWLRRLAARLRDEPATRWLVERRVVQFWCVGGGAAADPVVALPNDAAPDRLDALLDVARGARIAAELPGLDARHVQIVERASLFGAAEMADDARALRMAMELLRRDNFDADSTLTRFEYEWAVLLDATRPAERPSDVQIDAARSLLEFAVPHSRTFFIDRQDAGAAVIDPDLANEAFLPLAVSLVASDIGARRTDRPLEDLPRLLWSEADAGHVIPFSVMELLHPPSEIETARARSLLAQLVGGIEHAAAARVLGDPRALVTCARRDVAEVGTATYDPHEARKRRREAAVSLVAWAPVDDNLHDTAALLTEVRRSYTPLEVWLTPVRSTASIPSVSAMPALLALQGAGEVSWAPWAVAAVALAGLAGVVWRRRRAPVPAVPTSDPDDEARRAASRRDVAREWQAVVERVERLVEKWFEERSSARQEESGQVGHWKSTPPFSWRLHAAAAHADDLLVTPEVAQDIAHRGYLRLTDGGQADEALRGAAREVLRRAARSSGVAEDLASAHMVLAGSLDGSSAYLLHHAAASARFLAHTASAVTADAVVWLSHPALGLGESLLASVEPASTRHDSRAVSLTHDDVTRSVRLAFAPPIRWDGVLSLDCLRSA